MCPTSPEGRGDEVWKRPRLVGFVCHLFETATDNRFQLMKDAMEMDGAMFAHEANAAYLGYTNASLMWTSHQFHGLEEIHIDQTVFLFLNQ